MRMGCILAGDGLFVLVGPLLGFTLALAVPRYNERRTLLVEEAISIGTTYLRAAMLPQPYRDNPPSLRGGAARSPLRS
jgi:hypothetical protein